MSNVKCIVKGCLNHSDDGSFIGALCAPCRDTLKTGNVHHANITFIGDMKRELEKLDEIKEIIMR